MGREVRKVPANWQHPKDDNGRYKPMWTGSFDNAYANWRDKELPEWIEGERLWREEGRVSDYSGGTETVADCLARIAERRRSYESPIPANPDYAWYAGKSPVAPSPGEYMPNWPEDQRTHFMMYEDTSEGTPISPAFATAEELARWLADTGASSFGNMTASYEAWLRVAKGGFAPSMVIDGGVMHSGVEGMASTSKPTA